MNVNQQTTFALLAAIVVLFSAFLDARVSAILAVVFFILFAVIPTLQERRKRR